MQHACKRRCIPENVDFAANWTLNTVNRCTRNAVYYSLICGTVPIIPSDQNRKSEQQNHSRSSPSESTSYLTGMHKKSIEAADKLRDSDSGGESSAPSPSSSSPGPRKDEGNCARWRAIKRITTLLLSAESKASGRQELPERVNCSSPSKSVVTSPSSPMSPSLIKCDSLNGDLRSNSIASLRAKAMEHSAKVLQSSGQTLPTIDHHLNYQNNGSLHLYSIDRQSVASNYSSASIPYSFPGPRSVY